MDVIELPMQRTAAPHRHTAEDLCPTCEQPISEAQRERIRQRLEARAREQEADLTRRLTEQFERRMAAVTATARLDGRNEANAALEAQLQAAAQEKQADAIRIEALETSRDALIAERVAVAREAFERDKVLAVQAEQAKWFEQQQKLQEKLQAAQRQLENRPAQELGEAAEIDLFEALKAEFASDQISRVAKGAAGADIIHDIHYNGSVCGRIVYDAKNRNAWRNDYVTKLRQDQIAAEAAHAVLATRVFPSARQQLHEQDGIIIAHPARVLAVAGLLRRHVMQTYNLRISGQAREQKTAALYAFMTSDRCRQLLDSVDSHAGKMLALDLAEQRAHKRTWDERDKLIKSVQKNQNDLCFEIERIVGTAPGAKDDVNDPTQLRIG